MVISEKGANVVQDDLVFHDSNGNPNKPRFETFVNARPKRKIVLRRHVSLCGRCCVGRRLRVFRYQRARLF